MNPRPVAPIAARRYFAGLDKPAAPAMLRPIEFTEIRLRAAQHRNVIIYMQHPKYHNELLNVADFTPAGMDVNSRRWRTSAAVSSSAGF